MVERKVYKTKLCLLYQKGRCSRQSCSFAHGNVELRRSFGSYHGAREYRVGDLRDRLDRRLFPKRKYSPRGDARGRHTFRGHSPSQSSERKSDRKRRKKQLDDGKSDFSGNLRISDGIEDQVKDGNVTSCNSKFVQEQVREVQLDIDMLDRHKHQLEIYTEEKVQEADVLTSRIKELEMQLDKEKEECKRIASKIKKFIKAHNRHSRIQDELKRSQARLQKLGDQLGLDATGVGGNNQEDSSINVVSDEETTNYHLLTPLTEMQTISSPSKKKAHCDREKPNESIREGGARQAKPVQLQKVSRWSVHQPYSIIDRELRSTEDGNVDHGPSVDEGILRRGKNFSTVFTEDKMLELPSTGMAAHANAFDAEVEVEVEKMLKVEMASGETEKSLPVNLPPPPPLPNGY